MANRIKAIKSTFHLTLSLLEIIVAVVLILKMFGSDSVLSSIVEDVGDFADGVSSGGSSVFGGVEARGPMSFLALVLGFMFFAYILVAILPKAINKKEAEFDLDEIDLE